MDKINDISMECGGSTPLSPGQPRLSDPNKPGNVWHHSPIHILLEKGIYFVTAGTYTKENFFSSTERKDILLERLFVCAEEMNWTIQAWAVMSNHYHFVAESPVDPSTLRRMINKLHMTTARDINRMDGISGRKVWHEFWDTRLTFERSYLARLHYVNQNPVHHKLVTMASEYRWCSASHFESHAPESFQRTVAAFPIDKLSVPDDF